MKSSVHIISPLPSRADTARERGYRNGQRGAAQVTMLEAAEQHARDELATAIRWLQQACALDTPPGAYIPSARTVRSFASSAMNAAERARIEKRKIARGGDHGAAE